MKKSFYAAVVFLLVKPLIAFSATAVCTGKVKSVGIHNPERVFLTFENTAYSLEICNMGSTASYPSATGCKAMYAAALLAQTTGRNFTIYIDNAPTTSCDASLGVWFRSQTRYVEVQP